jgi:hypothetical protein
MVRKIQTIIICLFFSIILIKFVSSIAFEVNKESKLCHAVRVDGAIDSGVVCNLTITYPNTTSLINFKNMINEGDRFCYELNSTQNSKKGVYNYEITCNAPNGNSETFSSSYIINLGGIDPSQQRTDTTSRTIYLVFFLGILLFVGFLLTKATPAKWTFFLLSLLFFLVAVNFIFLSLQDEIVNPRLEDFFSSFSTISFILYRFIAFLIASVWLLTVFVTIFDKIRTSKARRLSEYG